MLAEKNTYIGSAYEQLQVISQDQQKRLEYEARLKATLDYNQGMLEAEQRGIQQGIQQERENTERERQKAEQERQKAEQERQKAEQERQRAEAAEARIRELEQMLNQNE